MNMGWLALSIIPTSVLREEGHEAGAPRACLSGMLSSIIRPTGPTRKLREWGGMVVMMVPQRMSVSAFSREWGDAEIFWGAKGQRSQHA
jgi:hypothetical protein